MLELNIDINNNFNLSRTFEKGKLLEPVFGPGLTGLQNLGNTCYMNSVVQSMFSLPEFSDRYLNWGQQHLMTCSSEKPWDCFTCQISKLCHGLCSGVYSIKKEGKALPYPSEAEEEEKTDEDPKGK